VLGLRPPTDPTLVIIALFVTILAALVTRSVRRRRQRNAAFAAALASGAYGPSGAHRGNQDGASVSKPVMWETFITSVYDEGTGWASISVRHLLILFAYYRPYTEGVYDGQPVAGETLVPAHEAKSQHSAPRHPRLRFPHPGTRPAASNPSLPSTAPPLESLASSSNPIYLTVFVSMPSPWANEKPRQGNGGPLEFGVTEVTCTPNVE
jgi:hypothetical protein